MDKARERLDHLKLQYGENDPYYAGFAYCLRLVEQTEGGWKSQRTEAEIMKALEDQKDLFLANGVFVRDALALLNRKDAKIGKLNFENLQMIASIKNLKAEAIKEVLQNVEKLKYPNPMTMIGTIIYGEDFDRIAAEMGVE